jgi:hypothetical protein
MDNRINEALELSIELEEFDQAACCGPIWSD